MCYILWKWSRGEWPNILYTHFWIQSLSWRIFFPEKLLLLYFFLKKTNKHLNHRCLWCISVCAWLFQVLPGSSASSDWKFDMIYSRIHEAIHSLLFVPKGWGQGEHDTEQIPDSGHLLRDSSVSPRWFIINSRKVIFLKPTNEDTVFAEYEKNISLQTLAFTDQGGSITANVINT